jgi:hypothetical protein
MDGNDIYVNYKMLFRVNRFEPLATFITFHKLSKMVRFFYYHNSYE